MILVKFIGVILQLSECVELKTQFVLLIHSKFHYGQHFVEVGKGFKLRQ